MIRALIIPELTMSRILDRLKELGLELPHAPAAVGFYVPAVQTGNLVMTSGQLPFVGKEIPFTGKVGADIHEEEGGNAARICALNALAAIHGLIGDLDRITRVVRVEGFVQSAPGFTAQPRVINPASQFLVDVFGEAGKHTRIAVGAAELPLNAAVELSICVEVAG